MLSDIVSWYGLIALTHLFVQISLGHIDYLKSYKKKASGKFKPSVAVIIPNYNERNPDLEKCVNSAINQKYDCKYKVLLVDDGSKDKKAFYKIRREYRNNKILIIKDFKFNQGKRHVQKYGFDLFDTDYEIIVTIDSDTVLRYDAIKYLVQKFRNPKVGAVTGDVRVIKTNKLLSWLIDVRYWTAFNQERAAQSLFGTVLCCSGPLSAYRSSIIKTVKNKYINQKFLGVYCTYGDDRHLTNLVLSLGYKVEFERKAKAKTGVPVTIKQWLKQQVRWNKSFYRELLWTIKIVAKDPSKLNSYIIYDLAVQTILPLLLLFSLIFMVYRSIIESPIYLLAYLTILIGVALLRGTYALYRTGDKNFLLFPFYAFLHIFLLIPVRLYALTTLRKTKWGTR